MNRSRQHTNGKRRADGTASITTRLGRPMHIESLERRCPMDAALGSELVSSELALRELDDASIACEVATMPGPVWVQSDSSSPHESSLPPEALSPSELVTQPKPPPADGPLFESVEPAFETEGSDLDGQNNPEASNETDTTVADTVEPPAALEGNDAEPMLGDGEGLRTLIDPLQLLPWGPIDASHWATAGRLPSNQTMRVSDSTGGVRLLHSELDSLDASSSDFAHDDISLTDTIYFMRNDETDANDRVLESVTATLSLRRFAVRSNLAGNGMSIGSISIGPVASHARDMKSRPSLKFADDREERMASVPECRDLRERRDLLDRASEALVDLALKAFVKDASQVHDPNAGHGLEDAAEALAVTGLVQQAGGQAGSRETKSTATDSRAVGSPTIEFARNLCRIAVLGFVLTQHGMLKKANADILKGCLKR